MEKKNLACFLELAEELGPSKQELHEEEVKIETNDNNYQQKKCALKELVVGKNIMKKEFVPKCKKKLFSEPNTKFIKRNKKINQFV